MKMKIEPVLNFVKGRTIGSPYATYRVEENNETILKALRLAEQLTPDKTLVVCERSKNPGILYVSQNSENVLGYTAREFAAKSIAEFMGLIHPEDVTSVVQCYDYINSFEPYNPAEYRFETFYRLQGRDGCYMHISDEKLALPGDDGRYIYIAAFRKISDEKFYQVKLKIDKCTEGTFRTITMYTPRQFSEGITPRQQEIIQLINKGFSNKEIADKLCISTHTIRNHKYSLFKKINVRTNTELINAMKAM